MRRLLPLLLLAIFLFGCKKTDGTEPALILRERLMESSGCSFKTVITADYGDSSYTFIMDCRADSEGNITFTVAEPETIQGITGKIDAEGGRLTFDERVLAFPLLTDGQLTPVSVPWLLMRTLRGGYISAGGRDGENYKIQMDDSYEEDPLRVDIWLNEENVPIHCDFMWNNRRFLSAQIIDFAFL